MPHRQGWWTGDVWRTSLLLKRMRPGLEMTVLDAQPTGLVLITNLDPESRALSENYADHVRVMLSWELGDIGLPALFAELGVESAANLVSNEQITARYWL